MSDTDYVRILLTIPTAEEDLAESLAVKLVGAIRTLGHEAEAYVYERGESDGRVNVDSGVLGHQIANEAITRIRYDGRTLGNPSFYNIVRESVIDVVEREWKSVTPTQNEKET